MYSLKDMIDDYNREKSWERYWVYMGNFLDEFYSNPNLWSVIDEPEFGETCPDYISTFTAASCEYLCNKYKFYPPSWCMKDKYILKEPSFPSGAKGPLRFILLQESPIEYKSRNMYVGNNVLSRC